MNVGRCGNKDQVKIRVFLKIGRVRCVMQLTGTECFPGRVQTRFTDIANGAQFESRRTGSRGLRMSYTHGRRISNQANLQGPGRLFQPGEAAQQTVEDTFEDGVVEILDGRQSCRPLTGGAAGQHGLVSVAPIGVKHHFHLIVLHSERQKHAVHIESVRKAHSQRIRVICEEDANFTLRTRLFRQRPKEARCAGVFRDRWCNPQAASTSGNKLLQLLKLIWFQVEWIDDDDLVGRQVIREMR